MSNFEAPGVYVEETSSMADPIEGVGTSTVAFIGNATSGPVLEPILVTSWDQFESTFGGLDYSSKGSYLAHAVDLFFKNQGRRPTSFGSWWTRPGGRDERRPRTGRTMACLENLDDVNLGSYARWHWHLGPKGPDRALREDEIPFCHHRLAIGPEGGRGCSRRPIAEGETGIHQGIRSHLPSLDTGAGPEHEKDPHRPAQRCGRRHLCPNRCAEGSP